MLFWGETKSKQNISKIYFILLYNKAGKENGGLQFKDGVHRGIIEKVTSEESRE